MASELRYRFERHMILQRFAPSTQQLYMKAVEDLVRYYHRSPDQLTHDEIQEYLRYIIEEKKLAWSSVNVHFCGLLYFYRNILRWDETRFSIPRRPRRKQIPCILSRREIEKLLAVIHNIKHRALILTVYGSGLRVSEVVRLKPHHIESDRMMVRVEDAKGRKDRYTILSMRSLETLRDYWRVSDPKPGPWLFPGADPEKPMAISTAQHIYYNSKNKAGITRGKGIHTLRHTFATELAEAGYDIFLIKRMLGHASFVTTAGYIHVTMDRIRKVVSPLDAL